MDPRRLKTLAIDPNPRSLKMIWRPLAQLCAGATHQSVSVRLGLTLVKHSQTATLHLFLLHDAFDQRKHFIRRHQTVNFVVQYYDRRKTTRSEARNGFHREQHVVRGRLVFA